MTGLDHSAVRHLITGMLTCRTCANKSIMLRSLGQLGTVSWACTRLREELVQKVTMLEVRSEYSIFSRVLKSFVTVHDYSSISPSTESTPAPAMGDLGVEVILPYIPKRD